MQLAADLIAKYLLNVESMYLRLVVENSIHQRRSVSVQVANL